MPIPEHPHGDEVLTPNLRRRSFATTKINAVTATIHNAAICCQSMVATYAQNPFAQLLFQHKP
jgi:hypothetical protein